MTNYHNGPQRAETDHNGATTHHNGAPTDRN